MWGTNVRQCVCGLVLVLALAAACAPLPVSSDVQEVIVPEARDDAITGRVLAVEDGDRVVIRAGHMPLTIRLIGVDAPEKGQRYWKEARALSERLALGQEVTVRQYDITPTLELRGHVFLPDGRCLNEELLEAGLAWWVDSEVPDATFGFMEHEARLSGRGLWQAPDPVAPWKWRQSKDSPKRVPTPSSR
jgi:endonuclease YncB( thermonuclease family)